MFINKLRYNNSSGRNRASGFTLIEMLVTISIMAIIATISIPSFSQTLANQRIKNTYSIIFNTLKQAKAESYLRKTNTSVVYAAAQNGNAATIALTVPNPTAGAADIVIAKHELNKSSVVTMPANVTTVTFSNSGHLANAAIYTICDSGVSGENPKKLSVTAVANITSITGNSNDCT